MNSKAERALPSLKGDEVQYEILESRIALCKAAAALSSRAELSHNTLVGHLVMLQDYVQDFPHELAVRLTGRLLLEDIQNILRAAPDKPQERLDMITDFVLRLDLWSEEAAQLKLLDHTKASLAPVLAAMKASVAPVCEGADLFSLLEGAAEEDAEADAKRPAKKARKQTPMEDTFGQWARS